MKKYFLLSGVLAFAFALVGGVTVDAAKPTSACAAVQGGTLTDVKNNPIGLGYDQWGYNYQAHMFNGWYDNSSRPDVPASSGDRLMMKWNDAWLSNKSCDSDTKLDRHFGFPTYRESGAWLTNHASGAYESSTAYHWDIAETFVMSFLYGGVYDHDVTVSDAGGVLSGNGGYPVGGPYSYTWDMTAGSVSDDTFAFDAVYTGGPDAVGTVMHVAGAIASDGSMSGDWSDNYMGGNRVGTWSAAAGTAVKVAEVCSWNDFVKIVAVPSAGYLDGGMWYTDNTKSTEIGPEIWGEFAIIQEVSNDPCGEGVGLMSYKSQLHSGLGNWQY